MTYERPEGNGFCIIKKTCDAEMDGKKGTLVWDYLIFNEITFVNAKTRKVQSLFCSWSDEKAEKTFNDLCRKYAIGNINLQKTSTESEDSGRAEGSEVDLTRVTLANLEGMEKYDSNCVNIRYDGKLIGWMTYGIKGNDENGKKVVLINATIDKNYRGKHIFSYAIKQMADLYPVEIVVKRFPEYEDMALHLLNYKNVIEGK